MTRPSSRARRAGKSVSAALAFLFAFALVPPPPRATARVDEATADRREASSPAAAPSDSLFRQTNFISDVPGLAPILDPLLVNPWGIAKNHIIAWNANSGTNTARVYFGDFAGGPFIPTSPQSISLPGGRPTGMVLNISPEFTVTSGTVTERATAIFVTLAGEIVGYSNAVPAPGSPTGFVMASNPGSVYTGLALRLDTAPRLLFAADFANGKIDVYNTSYALTTVPGGFADATIPAGYAPYNIQNLGNSFYVTYAKVGPGNTAEAGVGKGYVRKFNEEGVRDASFAIDAGPLNAPWGIGIAPEAFDPGFEDTNFGEKLVVGNSGEGGPSIHVFNPATGAFLGTLADESGNAIRIDGLRGLLFASFDPFGGSTDSLYFTAGLGDGQHGLLGKLRKAAATTSLIQFAGAEFSIGEGLGHVDVTVTRTGDLSGAATVNFNTFDRTGDGHASQKSDYEIALGTLRFAPGETSKTFRVLIVDDLFDEGAGEVLRLMLSNPTGAGAGLGSPNTAELTINDNDTGAPASNPIDDAGFFVRQHYLDFLNREPDAAGLAFWTNEIATCGANAACVENKRVNVSAAFFLSIEFQNTGYLAYRAHRAAFGETAQGSPVPVYYGSFMRDTQALQKGFVFGQPGADEVLEANKAAYFNEFVTRPEFVVKYPSGLTSGQYVDALLASAGLSPSQVRLFVVQMTNSQENPPVTPTLTTGAPRPASFGTARFQFNEAQTALTFTATITNIDVTGSQTADTNDNLTAAHIHAGGNAPPANNPVVWGFFGAPFNDNNPNDQVFFPNPGVGGTFGGKWDAPEGNNTTLAAQLNNLREGRAYINFHTRQFPGGEIRGNFPAATAFRDSLVAGLNGATETRATVLRKVAEAEELQSREFNRAFVAMQYFGYLRRDPDTSGYNFWLNKLNSFNGNFQNAEMVKAFINSLEYRQRFGPS